jgi:uncharacterized protein YwqG
MVRQSWHSLLDQASSEQKSRLEKLLLENNLACICASPDGTVDQKAVPLDSAVLEPSHSRLGGTAFLPNDVPYPCDRSSRPMMLVALINFAQLPPCNLRIAPAGIFMLFWNAARDSSNPKDRHAFKCIWLPDSLDGLLPPPQNAPLICDPLAINFSASYSVPSNDSFWTENASAHDLRELLVQDRNDSILQLFGTPGDQFEILQEIAAFSGNGVSWSQARSKDSCFSHLVDNAREWRLFIRIKSSPELGLDLNGKSINLLIRQEDLDAFRYDKSWLVVA